MCYERLLILGADRIQPELPKVRKDVRVEMRARRALRGRLVLRENLHLPAFRKLVQRCHPTRTIFHSIDSAKYLFEFSFGQPFGGIFLLCSQRRPALHSGYRAVLLHNIVPIFPVPHLPFQNYAATLMPASRHRPSF